MGDIIETRDLRKSFGKVEAVRGISFRVAQGEIFGFLGPNGAGKTTTQRMLTTLLPIDGGRALVAGVDVAQDPATVRTKIGYVSQLGGADSLATGRENLVLQARLYGLGAAHARRNADEMVEILDIADIADRRVNTYSGGQRRRLDVALGIVHEPALLFLDEPTTGLDPQNRANLWEHIRRLRDRGATVFLTTHYLDEADELCERVMIMDHGTIVAEGSPQELKRRVSGDAIVVDVKDADRVPDALELMAAQPYVREATADGTRVRSYVEHGGAVLPDLLRILDRSQIAVATMTLSEPTLDDVFLRHTGRSLRDGDDGHSADPDHGGEG